MKIRFPISGLPPKKDGANSMWRKGVELPRLQSLRLAAIRAMQGRPLAESNVSIKIELYANPRDGDLDNFINGICDGLMAAHPMTPIDLQLWMDLPKEILPSQPIIYKDDSLVKKISAERFPPENMETRYEIEIEFE